MAKARWAPQPSGSGLRRCTKCLHEWPATAEWFHKADNVPGGLHTRCKGCRRAHMKRYRPCQEQEHAHPLYIALGVCKCWACGRAVPLSLAAKTSVGRRPDQCKPCLAAAVRRNWHALSPTERKARTFVQNSKRGRKLHLDAETKPYVAILRRDPCCYCGGKMQHIDHIVPVAAGGLGTWDNLTAACSVCNYAKKTKPLLEFMLS